MLMPWLTGTAFLHSVMMAEKRGMLKRWNMILIILTYSLSLFGTFITRTGIIGSVHAFAKSAMGPAFFAFIGLTFLGSMSLLFSRWPLLKSEHDVESFASREAAFLLQNMLFLAITFAVFWGTVFPMISELVTGNKITVGPPYFKMVTGPLFATLVLLMSIAPFFAWRKQGLGKLLRTLVPPFIASGIATSIWVYVHRMHPGSIFALWLASFVSLAILYEFWRGIRVRMTTRQENPLIALVNLIQRNHRRYGGDIIHLGVIMIALGFIGEAYFKQETQGTVAPGQSLTIGGYSLRFNGLREYPGSDGRDIVEASTSLYQGDQLIRTLEPRRDYFIVQKQPSTVPAVYSTPGKDVYVLLAGWGENGTNNATFKIYINPLINWVWIGAVFMVLGTLIGARSSGKQEASYAFKTLEIQPTAGD